MRRGFTLVELIAVIVVLAILAAVAVPKYFDMASRARINAAKAARAALATGVDQWRLHSVANGTLAFPATLDIVLESADGDEYLNPYRLTGQPTYLPDPDNSPTKWNPQIKTVEERMQSQYPGCIWYNNMNGSVRFCVAQQSTVAATIELYNEVNGTNVTSIGQTGN